MAPGNDISVVIPSRGEGAQLLHCIDAVSRLNVAGEIVVAAFGEHPGVRDRATRCPHLRWVECDVASRGVQMNQGAAATKGDVLLFLHADTQLPMDAALRIPSALLDSRTSGGAFRLTFDVEHPALRLLTRLSGLSITPTFLGDQAMFCRRSTFESLGGFRDMCLFEDVEFARRLAHAGRLVRVDSAVRTSARRFVHSGPWRQLARNAFLLSLYHAGVAPDRLARSYAP